MRGDPGGSGGGGDDGLRSGRPSFAGPGPDRRGSGPDRVGSQLGTFFCCFISVGWGGGFKDLLRFVRDEAPAENFEASFLR